MNTTERRAAVVTVSDGVTAGTRADTSGDEAERLLHEAGFEVATRTVVADERSELEPLLAQLSEKHALVVTTGGTGFGPRDVTPEATKAVIDREAPGLAELMRAAGLAHTPMAALSRAVAGARGSALILNLPGSPKGVVESLKAVMPVVDHAVALLAGGTGQHPTGHVEGSSPPNQGLETAIAMFVDVKAIKVIGNPPCRVGNAMSIVPGGEVHGTLGCAEFDAAAVEAAAAISAAGAPGTRTFHHELGDVEVYLEPHEPPARLLVVSATDVARSLRSTMRRLGRHVILVEPRSERVVADDEPRAESLEGLHLDRNASIVFTDHDAPGITEMLTTLLRSEIGFIGVMGSRRHVAHYVEDLRAAGFGDDDLARIRSPLGLDIGGRSPEEIALSIAAGLVAAANDKAGGWLDR